MGGDGSLERGFEEGDVVVVAVVEEEMVCTGGATSS